MEHGEVLGGRVVARVVPEGSLAPELALLDVPLEDDLCVRRHLEIDGLRPHELDRLVPEKPGQHELVDVLRQRSARRVGRDRIESERDGDLETLAHTAPVGSTVLVDLPVHEGRARVDLLHPVHPDIACAVSRVLRDHRRQRDERCGITRPAVLDRKEIEVRLEDELLGRPASHRLRHRVGQTLELAKALDLLDQTLWRLHLEHLLEPPRDVIEVLDTESQAHSALGAELVDQQRALGAFGAFEEERGAAALHRAIDDLRNLEERIDLGFDLDQLPFQPQAVDPLAEVGEGHRVRV